MTYGIVIALWLLALVPVAPQEKPAPPLPLSTAQAPPAVPELIALRIENAVLKANRAQQQYQAIARESGQVIQTAVAQFEKEFPGWTLDTQKMVAVKKPEPKKDGK
jgi:hypothetical protein